MDSNTYYLASNPSNFITLTAISTTASGLTYNNTTGVISLTVGYVIPLSSSATNWDTAYNSRIASLTTTGDSGNATFISNVLNIPTITLSGIGGQPVATNLTSLSTLNYVSTSFVKMTGSGAFSLDTNTYYLASNPSSFIPLTALSSTALGLTYTNTTGVFSLTAGYMIPTSVQAAQWNTAYTNTISSATGPLSIASNVISIALATASISGYLSASDFNTFNNKENLLIFSSPLIRTVNTITISQASGSVNGYLSSVDWSTFNNKQATISLTTTGTSGAATFSANTLNIPNYGSGLSGFVPYTGATGAVNLGAYDLTVNTISVGLGGGAIATNTRVGVSALQGNSTGNSNTAIGHLSLGQTTITGTFNTGVGINSVRYVSSGSFNTGIGGNALINVSTSSNNVAVGVNALQGITTGGNNTSIGFGAGGFISGGSVNNITGSNSTFIGYNAYPLADAQTNQVVIGYAVTGLGSNTTVLGNSSTVTTAIYGNLLLGTTTAAGYKLDVNGTARVSGAATFSSSVTADSLLVNRTASRNMLGISSIALPTSGAEEGVSVIKTNALIWQLSTVGYDANSKGVRFYNNGGSGNTAFEVTQFGGTRFIIDGGGLAAIGTSLSIGNGTTTTAPTNGLAVNSSITIGGTSASGTQKLTVLGASGLIAGFTNQVNADLVIDLTSGVSLLRTNVGAISLGATSTEGLRMFASTRNVVIQNGGTFTDAGYRLDVNGTARVQGVLTLSSTISNGTYTYTLPSATGTLALTSALSGYVPTSRSITINGTAFDLSADRTYSVGTVTGSGTTNFISKFTGSTALGNSLIYDNGTSVGIGTTSATAKLEVISSSDGLFVTTSNASQTLRLSSATNNNTLFRINNFNNNFYDIQNQPSDNSLVIDYNDTERLRITSEGGVNINSSTTGYTLNAIRSASTQFNDEFRGTGGLIQIFARFMQDESTKKGIAIGYNTTYSYSGIFGTQDTSSLRLGILVGSSFKAKIAMNTTTVSMDLPTSASGLNAGDLYNDSGTVKIV